jgi:hypothetical protein
MTMISKILIGSMVFGLVPLAALADSKGHDDSRQTVRSVSQAVAAHRRQIARGEKSNGARLRVPEKRAFSPASRSLDSSVRAATPNPVFDDYCDLPSTGCTNDRSLNN